MLGPADRVGRTVGWCSGLLGPGGTELDVIDRGECSAPTSEDRGECRCSDGEARDGTEDDAEAAKDAGGVIYGIGVVGGDVCGGDGVNL